MNPGVRGLSSSPALHSSNFYTITYEVGETGEKHTVQVNIDQSGRTMNIEHMLKWSSWIPGKRGRQPAGHCHQQRHRLGRVWGMWGHPCLFHLSCRVHTGLYSASDQNFLYLVLPGGFCQDRWWGNWWRAGHVGPCLWPHRRVSPWMSGVESSLNLTNPAQVCMTKALDGVVVKVPEGVNDQRWE